MATYTIDNILPAVRTILDYNEDEDELGVVGEVDTLALDKIITSQAQDALRYCMMNCPKEWVTWGRPPGTGSVKTDDDTHYYYQQPLPDGYLRFGSAMLSSWKVPCYSVVGPEDKEYLKQFQEFEGLKATPLHPVTALMNTTTGTSSTENAYLQMFGSVTSGTTLTYCNIAVLPDVSTSWTMKSQLLAPMVAVTAAFTAQVLKDQNKFASLMNQAQVLLTTAEETRERNMIQAALQQQQQQ